VRASTGNLHQQECVNKQSRPSKSIAICFLKQVSARTHESINICPSVPSFVVYFVTLSVVQNCVSNIRAPYAVIGEVACKR
jgi:hypothetical protein